LTDNERQVNTNYSQKTEEILNFQAFLSEQAV
ncbi:MAG: hypothetical protein RJA81_1216, partial [Planctomycetota bacterium]